MLKYTSHTYVPIVKEKRLYAQVQRNHGKCLGQQQAKAQRRFCGFPALWFPCSSQPTTLRTARTSAFLPRSCLPAVPTTSLPGTGQTGTLRGRPLASQPSMPKRRGILLPSSRGHLVARDPGAAACPRPAAAGELPQVHSASPHENKTPACSGSALNTLLRGSYKSCQHGLPQAFSFSNTPGVWRCLSVAPPPSIFSEKASCVPTVFIDIPASWLLQLREGEPPSPPFKVAPVPTHCP